MLKRLTGTYVEGRRSREVLKWKFWKTADLICGTVGREGKDSVQLLALDKETSELVDVGSAATQGKGKLQRGDVIEVRYLYFTGSRLYQTNILRRRSDKDAAACWLDQLETTNKFAFETT